MPKSPKKPATPTAAKPKPDATELIELHVIDPVEFTSRAAARKFVRSDRFAAYSDAVGYAAAPWPEGGDGPEIEDAGRNVASFLCDDLATLARVAADAGDAPVMAARSKAFDLRGLLVGLLELGRGLAAASGDDATADAMLLLAASAAHNVSRGEPVDREAA